MSSSLNSKRIIVSLVLASTISQGAFAKPDEGFIEKAIRKARSIVDYAIERPLLAGATVAAGVLAYMMFRARDGFAQPPAHAPAGADHARGAALGLVGVLGYMGAGERGHQHAPPPQDARPDIGSLTEHQMLDLALQRSAQEATPFQQLEMGAGEYNFNVDIFRAFVQLESDDERVMFLRALLYNHDHTVMEHDALLAFVMESRRWPVQQIVKAFHELAAGKWSLLKLAPEAAEIDPEAVPAPNYERLLEDYRRMRQMPVRTNLVEVYAVLDQGTRHAVETAILKLIARRLYFPQGLLQNQIDLAEFAMMNLFGEQAPPIPSAPAEDPMPELEEVPVEVARDREEISSGELRRKRIAKFGKNTTQKVRAATPVLKL